MRTPGDCRPSGPQRRALGNEGILMILMAILDSDSLAECRYFCNAPRVWFVVSQRSQLDVHLNFHFVRTDGGDKTLVIIPMK